MLFKPLWPKVLLMPVFKKKILNAIVHDLNLNPKALAAWEGGSAANGTSDQYSDIDLTVVGSDNVDLLFDSIESTLSRVSKINHRWIEPSSHWPGCFHRLYILADSPKHFFVDVAVFLHESKNILHEFSEIERHGNLVIHFDKLAIIKPRSGDFDALKVKQLERLGEIEEAFPIYKTNVLKELDREHSIDAFFFYFSGMVKPLVEVMGILHRPFRFDFGLRYLHKTFPLEDQKLIENFLYVRTMNEVRENTEKIELLFKQTATQIRDRLGK